MKIGHCQLESLSGDFDANLDKVVKGMERAEREGVQIVCFPECFLTGYQDNGVGYGDSYIVDPYGEILVRSRRHQEDFISAEIDPSITDKAWKMGQSRYSIPELHRHLMEAAEGRG